MEKEEKNEQANNEDDEEKSEKVWLIDFVFAGSEEKIQSELNDKLYELQKNNNDFELVDIKLSEGEGRYSALIIYKDYLW